jgi:phage gp37-like protein
MIEAALLALLEPLSSRQGGYLARLDQYNGEIGAGASVDEILTALGGSVPAVLLQTGSALYSTESTRRTRSLVTLQIEILVASGHLRSHEARNIGDEASVHDDAADPGAYQILADIRDTLNGRSLGISGVSVPRLASETVVMQATELTAWVSRFEIDYRHEQVIASQPAVTVDVIEARSNLNESASVNPVVVGEVTNG